jgi:hypothetical protein
VARIIADLANSDQIEAVHLAEAIQYQPAAQEYDAAHRVRGTRHVMQQFIPEDASARAAGLTGRTWALDSVYAGAFGTCPDLADRG